MQQVLSLHQPEQQLLERLSESFKPFVQCDVLRHMSAGSPWCQTWGQCQPHICLCSLPLSSLVCAAAGGRMTVPCEGQLLLMTPPFDGLVPEPIVLGLFDEHGKQVRTSQCCCSTASLAHTSTDGGTGSFASVPQLCINTLGLIVIMSSVSQLIQQTWLLSLGFSSACTFDTYLMKHCHYVKYAKCIV